MNENMDRMELSLDDLDEVVGGGNLEILYTYWERIGFNDELRTLLPQGIKVVTRRQEQYVLSHIAEMRQNVPIYKSFSDEAYALQIIRDYSKKIYGML